MPANIEVWLDEDNQLILQRIEGEMAVEDFDRLDSLTAECVERLREPGDVRILADGRKMKPVSLKVRRRSLEAMRPNVKKLAFFGQDRINRVMSAFLAIVGGPRMHSFETEEEAREWLLS